MEETDIGRHMQFAPLDKIFNNFNNKDFFFEKINHNTGGPALYYKSHIILI